MRASEMFSQPPSNSRRNLILAAVGLSVVVVTVIAVMLSLAAFEYWWRGTPPYSLAQIGRAIETHDLQLFRKHVDLRSVANRMIDDVMNEQKRSGSAAGNSALGSGIVEMFRPRLVEAFEAQVERFVETGQFQDEKGTTDLSLKEMSARNSIGPVVYTKIDGKVSLVGLTVTPRDTKKSVVVDLKMRQTPDGYWQLMEIDFAKLLRQTKAG